MMASRQPSDTVGGWFSNNGMTLAVLVGWIVTGSFWAARLESRMSVIEQRGSPEVVKLESRMSIMETRQLTFVEIITDNSRKLDKLFDVLNSHLQQQK